MLYFEISLRHRFVSSIRMIQAVVVERKESTSLVCLKDLGHVTDALTETAWENAVQGLGKGAWIFSDFCSEASAKREGLVRRGDRFFPPISKSMEITQLGP